MEIARSKKELHNILNNSKDKTKSFIPTMGSLHEGHLSLIDLGKNKADIVISSIFVNPKQFAPHEDYDEYPRNESEDLKLLKERGTDVVYIPDLKEMYSKDFSVTIDTGKISSILEGQTRPHFFNGVATVVIKLFMQIMPNYAIFGEKDYQQLIIIKKLVKDFDIPIEIVAGEIVRENNGLAMSSRNKYLNDEQKEQAGTLYKVLSDLVSKYKSNSGNINSHMIGEAEKELVKNGFTELDYITFRDARTLSEIRKDTKEIRLLAAAYINKIRLIDNLNV